METINTNIVWHKASEELPPKSGWYWSITKNGTVSNVPYSAKHKRFNFYDHYDPEELDVYPTIFWAEAPEMFLWENLEEYRN